MSFIGIMAVALSVVATIANRKYIHENDRSE